MITFTDWQWLHSCSCGFVYTCGTSSVDAADCACVNTVVQCVCKQGSVQCCRSSTGRVQEMELLIMLVQTVSRLPAGQMAEVGMASDQVILVNT